MPSAALFLPPRHLSGCFYAAIHRDTRGMGLAGKDRYNHFPASPLMSVTVLRHGELFLVPRAYEGPNNGTHRRLTEVSAMPPTHAPTTSWSPNEVEAITIGFFPDAWLHLGGDTALGGLIPDKLMPPLTELRTAQDIGARWSSFCDHLGTVWAQARPDRTPGIRDLSDWARAVIARAAISRRGASIRSFTRQLKRLSGHSKQTLAFYAAFENLHRIRIESGNASLAEIAADAGYADQSHMGRAVRRATGFSPAELNRAIDTQEAFWCYRLLGERF